MDSERLEKLIIDLSRQCNVDSDLALAIAYVESGLNPYTARYEPLWRYLVTPERYALRLGITIETEIQLQKFSYGALQIMGSNARVLNFNGMITLLVQPQLGTLYALKHLQMLQRKYSNELDLISSYNQGSPVKINKLYRNQIYVQKVLDRLAYLRGKNGHS